jgi:hypothetical protein
MSVLSPASMPDIGKCIRAKPFGQKQVEGTRGYPRANFFFDEMLVTKSQRDEMKSDKAWVHSCHLRNARRARSTAGRHSRQPLCPKARST